MYNEKILSQLQALNFLHVTKNSNVSAMAKKNEFGDAVKFYAQIDKNEVVNKISYKATGCTYFVVFCNHFCELVQGKTIEEGLKINIEQLEQFVELDENRRHVAEIIIHTFELLAKKFRKGVQSGKIIPVDVEEQKNVETVTEIKQVKEKPVKEKKISIKEHKEEKLTKAKSKVDKKSTAVSSVEIKQDKETVVNENSIKQANNLLALKSMVNNSKPKENPEEKKKETNSYEVKKLSKMINKLSNNQDKPEEDENSKKLHSISANLANLSSKNKKKDSKESKEKLESAKSDSKESKEVPAEDKKKKSFFDWFKRK